MAGTPVIRKAGKARQQVQIEYVNKKGKTIRRLIRPYEIKNGMVYATDNNHGAGRIHSFKQSRIKSAEMVEKKFKPRWDVKL
jgi:predicted DNA-binding transcriptional regulator YafY